MVGLLVGSAVSQLSVVNPPSRVNVLLRKTVWVVVLRTWRSVYSPAATRISSPETAVSTACCIVAQGISLLVQVLPLSLPVSATYRVPGHIHVTSGSDPQKALRHCSSSRARFTIRNQVVPAALGARAKPSISLPA